MTVSAETSTNWTSREACLDRLLEFVEMVRQGSHFAEAKIAIAKVIDQFPDDVSILHTSGVIQKLMSEFEEATGLFQKVLELHPGFYFSQIEIAAIHQEAGDKREALAWYRRAIAAEPGFPLAYIRAALLCRELGMSWDGLLLLDDMHKHLPDHIEGNLLRAEFLQYHGRRPEVAIAYKAAIDAGCRDSTVQFNYMRVMTEIGAYESVLKYAEELAPTSDELLRRHCAVFSGHARLALAYDSERLSAAISRHELSAAWLSVNGLVERLKSAIENHQPLSFVRLGDGEARFLAYVTPSIREQLSPEEAESIIDIIWHNWFGHPIKQDHSENINEVRELFQNALQSADILGVTTSDRYVKDTFHRGYLNVLQSLIGTVIDECPGMALTNALIPMELHRHSPFFSDILSGLDFVGVISPHPGLAGRLARYHGITKSREYIIPGETRLPEAIRHLTGEAHLPDVFRKLLRNICVPYRGAVFLVAAGLLGKIYCARIRNLGGVAIDVGSIVDAWMGQNTRPGQYDKTEEWILPDAPQIMGFTEYKPDSA